MKYILCIDDDPTSLSILKITFKLTQFCEETLTKMNGQEAIDFYENLILGKESNVPELIFLDLNMPVLDGWGFLEIFKERYFSKFPFTKVYILSSSVDPSDKKRSEKYEFVQSFLSKPLSKEVVQNIKLTV